VFVVSSQAGCLGYIGSFYLASRLTTRCNRSLEKAFFRGPTRDQPAKIEIVDFLRSVVGAKTVLGTDLENKGFKGAKSFLDIKEDRVFIGLTRQRLDVARIEIDFENIETNSLRFEKSAFFTGEMAGSDAKRLRDIEYGKLVCEARSAASPARTGPFLEGTRI
jgi:hypothetical protein